LLSCGAAAANQYAIEVRADRNLNVRGVETVVWRNGGSEASTEIPIVCACDIEEIVGWGRQIRMQNRRVVLPSPVPPQETASIQIHFKANAKGSYGYRMLADAWHPKIGTAPAGRSALERPQADSYDVTLTAPASLTVASSGEWIEKPAATGGQRKFHWRLAEATSFGLAASSSFVETLRDSEGVDIRLYQLRGDSRFDAKMADYAVDVVRFYKRLFGFYPHPAVVTLPGSYRSGGGYSPASGFVVFHKISGDYYERGYAAHEIGHQYWGFDTVLDDAEPCHWLGLGLGIYSDNLYMSAHGLRSVVGVGDYLDAAAKGFDTTLRQPPEKMRSLQFNWNGAICHAKSYAVMRMLADLMGPERFLRFLQTLLGRYRGRYLSADDFQNAAQAAADQDLGWFFHDWVDTNRTASYAIETVRSVGDSVEVYIRRTGTARFPVSVGLTMADGGHQVERIDPVPEVQTLKFAAAHDPIRVQIDPNGICPLMTQGKEVWERK
jgi:hypothetical protein